MKKIFLILVLFASFVFAEAPFSGKILELEQKHLDPVYELPIDKDSKFLCEASLKNGKSAYFVSVKSMMQVYQHQDYFKKHKLLEDTISTMYVYDYISGNKIDATKAVYLFGSQMTGPHGDDLIPFSSRDNAKLFMLKHGGTKILPYKKLTKGLIRYLDM